MDDCSEEGPDGFQDLTLKFDAQDVIAALGDVDDGDCRVVQLTGTLVDGTPIVGEDVVLILERGRGGGAAIELFRNIFIRGDSNTNGDVDLSDSVFTLNYLFLGGNELPCHKAGDANDDGILDLSDGVYTLNFLFVSRPPFLPAPYSGCAFDPTADELSCGSFEICNGR